MNEPSGSFMICLPAKWQRRPGEHFLEMLVCDFWTSRGTLHWRWISEARANFIIVSCCLSLLDNAWYFGGLDLQKVFHFWKHSLASTWTFFRAQTTPFRFVNNQSREVRDRPWPGAYRDYPSLWTRKYQAQTIFSYKAISARASHCSSTDWHAHAGV